MTNLFAPLNIDLRRGDCRDVLKTLPDNSIDGVVTDPPYALVSIVKRFGKEGAAPAKSDGASGVYKRASAGFMGQTWDTGEVAFSEEFWAEVYRVLKPGGHVVSFGGTRTYHRMVCAIEDAGFEIRDQIQWLYGTGFPKSHDVSKAIDRAAGAEREVVGDNPNHRPVSGVSYEGVYAGGNTGAKHITRAATPEAEQWEGWGTALKPANEPICLARKPLDGTVAQNVLKWGTGAINIDGCRVGTEDMSGQWDRTWNDNTGELGKRYSQSGRIAGKTVPPGRWPANIVHDGSDEVLAAFPETKSGVAVQRNRDGAVHNNIYGAYKKPAGEDVGFGDSGSAARFFYSAKASKADRGEGNTHPTVKPTDLMRWLCRLITPPGGVVLDPFMGSGSTGKAALLEGFRFVGIEREPKFFDIARKRISIR